MGLTSFKIRGTEDDGTTKPPEEHSSEQKVLLRNVFCPTCAEAVTFGTVGLTLRKVFATIRCHKCDRVCSSRLWECSCAKRWLLCDRHYLQDYTGYQDPPRKKHK